MGKKFVKWDFRDVSLGLQKMREFLLGRKHVFHHRFPPLIAPRSIPPPDVPRGPEYKYSDQWYGNRDALNSVKPPVVAPIAEGAKSAKEMAYLPPKKGKQVLKFPSELPTPGCVWWFDAHCYYKEVNQSPCRPAQNLPSAPPPSSPCPCPPPPKEASIVKVEPSVKSPCTLEIHRNVLSKPELPSGVCEPCKDDPKKKC